MEQQNSDGTSEHPSTSNRKFISAQRRYDNLRVRDAEITKRLCYECGEVILGGEKEYQDHILLHEAVYLAYQLYHSENEQEKKTALKNSFAILQSREEVTKSPSIASELNSTLNYSRDSS